MKLIAGNNTDVMRIRSKHMRFINYGELYLDFCRKIKKDIELTSDALERRYSEVSDDEIDSVLCEIDNHNSDSADFSNCIY